jgi:hypothetical protein
LRALQPGHDLRRRIADDVTAARNGVALDGGAPGCLARAP